jgi:acyl-CoA dehydrogenase
MLEHDLFGKPEPTFPDHAREEIMLDRTQPQNPFYTPEHEAFRDVMRRFVAREIEPYAHEWDEAGEFPRELYAKASEIGLLGLGFPEEFGGVPADQFMKIVASQ